MSNIVCVHYVEGDSPSGYIPFNCNFKLKVPFSTALLACNNYVNTLKELKDVKVS